MKLKSDFTNLLAELQQTRENHQQPRQERNLEKRAQKHMRRATPISDEAFAKLSGQLKKKELLLPDDAIQHMIRATVERDFLNSSPDGASFTPGPYDREQGWIRIDRLPISPLDEKQYAMFPRWQNAIATMHNLQHRLCYVLLRQDGETRLYLGAIPTVPGKKGADAGSQLAQAVTAQMPGIGIEIEKVAPSGLESLSCCGTVTGIPSARKITEYGEYQTMDQIAMGLRHNGQEQDFAVVVIAEPVPDSKIVEVLRSMENLGSEVHALTQYTKTEGTNSGDTFALVYSDGTSDGMNVGLNVGGGLGAKDKKQGGSEEGGSIDKTVGAAMGKLLKYEINASVSGGYNHGWFSSTSSSRSVNVGVSDSVSAQYINKSAMYCEALFDKHIERMKAGRNLGFWKTGVYVLADSVSNVETVMGMLRAVYSGDDTYVEPIRTMVMPAQCGAADVVRMYQHLPFDYPPVAEAFGSLYEDYTTPMTTEELSIATSLPRRDVPGLRLVRNSSRFATNPPVIRERKDGGKPVCLGEVLDTGARTHQDYRLDLNQLVRHTLVAGTNGSGKTYTCKYLLSEVIRVKVPFLVVEPAKDEYLEWALEQNKLRDARGEKRINIFAPGFFEIGSIAQNQEAEILAAYEAYESLNNAQKNLVSKRTLGKLETILKKLANLTGTEPKSPAKPWPRTAEEKKIPYTPEDKDIVRAVTIQINDLCEIKDLYLNPYQPTVAEGTWINLMTHLDRFKSALLSSMPMADVLPLVMEEALYAHADNQMSIRDHSLNGCVSVLEDVYQDDGTVAYPLVEGLAKQAKQIIGTRKYANDVNSNISAAVQTRVNALLLGWKKDLFNVVRSTNLAKVFEEDTVINLSHLTDDKDKALVMSVLLIALWEYRESKYNNDSAYKKQANANQLMHLTLIEEAHRMMPDVREDGVSGMNSQHNTAKMFSHMLSEIRAYGEGCIVVDQVPTRLIPDAVKNTNLKIIHRLTSADDIGAVSTSMRLRPDQEAVIGALQPGEAIACSDFDDAAAWIKVGPVRNQ